MVFEADEVLVELAKKDPESFGELYQRYVSRIYSYVYYRTGDAAEAEDLTEKVFFQALTHIKGYTHRGLPFSAWLYRIAHNVVANWYRDRKHRRSVPLDEAQAQREEGLEDIGDVEDRAEIRQLVGRLPTDRQHLIVLKYAEGLSNAEIGRVMGRSEGAVKALLFRTLKSLREEMDLRRDGQGKS